MDNSSNAFTKGISISDRSPHSNELENFYVERRVLFLSGVIDTHHIEDIVMNIFRWNSYDAEQEDAFKDWVRQPILIYLDSPGGLTSVCLSIIGAIKSSITPIYTIALSKAHSAAFFILLAGNKRYSQKYSSLLYHQLSVEHIDGKLHDINETALELNRLQKDIDDFVIVSTKIPRKKLKEINEKKIDWYMTPKEAIENGCIDEIM